MLPGLQRMEGYDYDAIEFVWDVYEIERERRRGMFDSITSLIDVINAEQRERRSK